jgi:hypothetical protein
LSDFNGLWRHFRVVPSLDAEVSVGRRQQEASGGLLGLSEKQYNVQADLARNCRFFLIERPGLERADSPLLGDAEPSHRPNPAEAADRI